MRATLVSWTQHPMETLYTIWEQSKTDDHLSSIIEEAHNKPDKAAELFRAVLDQEIPVAEAITFTFICENVPISWREQAVRHRIGVAYGDNFSVDVIPDMNGSSFWSQSHRLKNMGRFADDHEYYVPESIADDADAMSVYLRTMEQIQLAYVALVDLGVPIEDARNLLPLGATHRISMTINLRALKGIIGKRSCWILQAGIWGPMIQTMVDELCERIDPVFRRLVYPPCVTAGRFTECKFKVENERRLNLEDKMPPCPLWLTETDRQEWAHFDYGDGRGEGAMARDIELRIPMYAKLWDQPRLVETWEWENRDDS